MANIAYISTQNVRVSSLTQNTDRQEEMFKSLNIDKYFTEKVSGKNIKDRPQLKKLMEYVREGDTVIVESISRFGRSLSDLISLIKQLEEKGVQFKSLKEGDIDTTSATGKLVFNIFASLAEFERETIRERQAEGIAIAKEKGKFKGKQKKPVDEALFESLYKKWQNKEITKTYMQKKLGLSLSTLDRRIREYRDKKPSKSEYFTDEELAKLPKPGKRGQSK